MEMEHAKAKFTDNSISNFDSDTQIISEFVWTDKRGNTNQRVFCVEVVQSTVSRDSKKSIPMTVSILSLTICSRIY